MDGFAAAQQGRVAADFWLRGSKALRRRFAALPDRASGKRSELFSDYCCYDLMEALPWNTSNAMDTRR
jgi:hypothetical protein